MATDHGRHWIVPAFGDAQRGRLSFVDSFGVAIDFPIRRVFWVTDIGPGVERGGHYHKACKQAIIAINGLIRVTLNDDVVDLRDPTSIAIVDRGVCVTYKNVGDGPAAIVVLCSEPYDPEDTYVCSSPE